MVLTEDAAYFLASKKKIEFLQKVEGTQNGTVVKLMVRDKVRCQQYHLFDAACDVLQVLQFISLILRYLWLQNAKPCLFAVHDIFDYKDGLSLIDDKNLRLYFAVKCK